MESINEKIKRLRIETGVNKATVAKSAGLKQSSYDSIEKGDTKSISIEVGKGIAKALKISFNDLFDIEIEAVEYLRNELNAQIEKTSKSLDQFAEMAQKDQTIIDQCKDIIRFQKSAIISAILYSYENIYKDLQVSKEDEKEKIDEVIDAFISQIKEKLVTSGVFTREELY